MDGEFPAHWKLKNGQAVINKIENTPSFLITDGNYGKVSPRVKTESYLGNEFTIEYDLYFSPGDYGLITFFYTGNEEVGNVQVNSYEAIMSFPEGGLNKILPADISTDNFVNKWHHIAIAYKNKQVKIYCDQYRILVVPDCNFVPSRVEFGGIGSNENPMKFSNI